VAVVERVLTRGLKRTLFGFFVLSGFSGLLYQIVWIRMALASFGVITPFASLVVSVFMLGLALGTWLGGRYARPVARRHGISPIALYGLAELIIGLSAFALPLLFDAGRALLLPIGAMDSQQYLLLSSLVITAAMLPWCICMGATFPAMMAFIEQIEEEHSGSFSFLYLANVVGAMAGAIATSLALIELFGFSRSLWLAAAANFSIGVAALVLARRHPWREGAGLEHAGDASPTAAPVERRISGALAHTILFITGFTSMALEIVWMRAYTPVLGTLVYAFSGLLTVYLFATWLGGALYRRDRSRGRTLPVPLLVAGLAFAVTLPILVAIPQYLRVLTSALSGLLFFVGEVRNVVWMIPVTLISILPFCALLGYLTPMLVDEDARGEPERAGRAYAINIAGSIVGPLAAAYWLLPWLGARLSMVAAAASRREATFPARWCGAITPRR
jgi:spermidine synthase